MKRRVQEYVRSCDTCQRQKYLATSPGGLLQPLPIPARVWDDISMDFITGLPKFKGYEAIFVIVDRLSKYAHFILLKHPYTAKTLAEVFVKKIVRLHGVPISKEGSCNHYPFRREYGMIFRWISSRGCQNLKGMKLYLS